MTNVMRPRIFESHLPNDCLLLHLARMCLKMTNALAVAVVAAVGETVADVPGWLRKFAPSLYHLSPSPCDPEVVCQGEDYQVTSQPMDQVVVMQADHMEDLRKNNQNTRGLR